MSAANTTEETKNIQQTSEAISEEEKKVESKEQISDENKEKESSSQKQETTISTSPPIPSIQNEKSSSSTSNTTQSSDQNKEEQPQEEEESKNSESLKTQNSITTQKSLVLASESSSESQTKVEEKQKQSSQMQQKIEQNLNTAISAMGGFMSGIINKVQEKATTTIQNHQNNNNSNNNNNNANNSNNQTVRFRSEDIVQEREVLWRSAQNKKNIVYSSLKDWDNSRINSLNIHRNILEGILQRVDSRMKASQDNITGISTLFKVVVEQIKSSAMVHLPNVSQSHIYRSVYDKIYEGIHKFENIISEKKEKALAFAEKVDIDIFQSIISVEVESYSTTISNIRQNLLNLKRTLHEQQLKVNRKSQKVREVYQHNIDTSPQKRAKKDFQKCLYSFLLSCQDFRDFQIVLAKATIGFWKKAVELEKHRSKMIQRCIHLFNQLHQDYIINQNISSYYNNEIETILNAQIVTDEFIASHMDFNNIILQEDQIYIATQLKKQKKIVPEQQQQQQQQQQQTDQENKSEQTEQPGIYDITISEVFHFLNKIYYPQFDDIGLAHKKMHLQREISKDHIKNTTILITPDNFLLCYDDQINNNINNPKQDESNTDIPAEINKQRSTSNTDDLNSILFYQRKPDFQMQIQSITLKKNNLTLNIKSQPLPSFMSLLRSSDDIKIIFKGSDQMEEFIQIIQALQEIKD